MAFANMTEPNAARNVWLIQVGVGTFQSVSDGAPRHGLIGAPATRGS
jgi:hypothetical protein